jgi:hypothetical protein
MVHILPLESNEAAADLDIGMFVDAEERFVLFDTQLITKDDDAWNEAYDAFQTHHSAYCQGQGWCKQLLMPELKKRKV